MKEGAKAWRAKESAKAKEAEQKRAEEQNSESASLAAATAAAEQAQAEVCKVEFRISLGCFLVCSSNGVQEPVFYIQRSLFLYMIGGRSRKSSSRSGEQAGGSRGKHRSSTQSRASCMCVGSAGSRRSPNSSRNRSGSYSTGNCAERRPVARREAEVSWY